RRRKAGPSVPRLDSRGRGNERKNRSTSVLIGGAREHRADDDFQIEPERPIVDVIQIVLDALSHLVVGVGLAAIAVDLRPAGDARPDVMTPRITRNALLVFAIVRQRVRSWADQRHIASEYIKELGNLVDVPASQPEADPSEPRIIGARLADHRAV